MKSKIDHRCQLHNNWRFIGRNARTCREAYGHDWPRNDDHHLDTWVLVMAILGLAFVLLH